MPENRMRRSTCFLLSFAVIAICIGAAVGISLHYALKKPVKRRDSPLGDCFPNGVANEQNCQARGCLWEVRQDKGPWCTFPSGYGYRMEGEPTVTPMGYFVNLTRIDKPTMFGNDVNKLVLYIDFHGNETVRLRFEEGQGEAPRFKVPKAAVDINIPPNAPPQESHRLYTVELVQEPQFGVKVIRKSTNAVVFDTTYPGFTFSDQYIQLTTGLPSGNLYGFGEHNHRQYKHDMDWKKWSIFTRDVAPVDDWNLYGAQPMYMNLENDGNANGVMLLNSNAMDVVVQPDPYPAVTFHVIGGILDFIVFLGPEPENVVQQFTYTTGRPIMMPYWSLGFQLSRWDYGSLDEVKKVVDRNRDAGIPLDVQYGDIDYMESKYDFTYDKALFAGLPEFVDELHSRGQRYIIILDHCIGSDQTIIDDKLNGIYLPYSEGIRDGIFIKYPNGTVLEGEVWPGKVHYPDFSHPQATDWWTRQSVDFYNGTRWGVDYDALWIDMNEPSNFVPGSTGGCVSNKYNSPPYIPRILDGDKGHLYEKTICMETVQEWGNHYDTHNLYGHAMSITTWNTLRQMFPKLRPFVLTRSQFLGTQKYSMHWLGDNQSEWRQIPWSIIAMLEYSLFGFTYTGADICGFWYATTEEMCQRWMQIGAFYPYSRNHNAQGWPDQDPAAFSEEMIKSSRDVLLTRYKLLPFLYTLLHEGHIKGSTVARPLLHEFPTDSKTWDVDRQFLWGPSLLISPVMEQGQRSVNAYFPSGRWYDYFGGMEVTNTGAFKNLSTPLDKINLHVRGGYVIPWQIPANTTKFSRMNPMGVIVALGPSPRYEAKGSLFWDDGISYNTYENGDYLQVDFECAFGMLDLKVTHNNYPEAAALTFDTIDIWGLSLRPSLVEVDGSRVPESSIVFDSLTRALRLNLDYAVLNITSDHTIIWENFG